METFNIRLKTLRKERNKTQQNVADLLKIRRSTYGEYERGKIIPPMDKLKVLSDYFGVSIDYLIGNEEASDNPPNNNDACVNIKKLLEDLKKNKNLTFEGEKLNEESRKLLIASLENSLEMAKIIKRK